MDLSHHPRFLLLIATTVLLASASLGQQPSASGRIEQSSAWLQGAKAPNSLPQTQRPGPQIQINQDRPSSMESPIQFKNRNGKWLRGMIHWPAAQDSPAPAVVFFHGFTGDRLESHWIFVKCARALAQAGIASLRFDFYGSGESEGDFTEMTLRGEIDDAQDAVNFIRGQEKIDEHRLGLCGLSMGGTVAAMIAPSVDARAVVLWNAVAHLDDLRRLIQKSAHPLPGPKGDLEYDSRVISAQFLDQLDEINPLAALSKFHRPTLILQGANDAVVPLSHGDDLFKSSPASIKEKVIVPGASHTFAPLSAEIEVIHRTVQWFAKYLAPSKP